MQRNLPWLGILLAATVSLAAAKDSPYRSIAKDDVNVRASPATQAEVLFRVSQGYPVKIEKAQGGWLRISDWEGDSGWIRKDLVTRAHTIVITSPRANVRSGPGMQYPPATVVDRGALLRVVREQNGWLQLTHFDTRQTLGWIYRDVTWGY